MAIAEEMQKIFATIEIVFASYATGAKTFMAAGRRVTDLQMAEDNRYLETLFKAERLIEQTKPDIVIAHEEFAAIAAAHLSGVANIFLSAWLPPQGTIAAESLGYADAIIVLEEPGIFPLPVPLRAEPRFAGKILRKMKCGRQARQHLRAKFKVPKQAFVVLVSPGGSATEEKCPIANTVFSAYAKLAMREKALFWVTSRDMELLKQQARLLPNVHILPFHNPIEELIAMSDVVITKGTRGATLDAVSVGVPSISLSFGTNPIDDLLVPRIKTNIALNARATDGAVLAYYLENLPKPSLPHDRRTEVSGNSVTATARILLEEIRRLAPLRLDTKPSDARPVAQDAVSRV